MAAASSIASRRERWKNRGSTSWRFSGVSTFARWTTAVMQICPVLSGSTISGNLWTSSTAVLR
jgi:hypothetical protein